MTTNRFVAAATAACAAFFTLVPQAAAREGLTLRVNDAIAPPGGLAAIVVRTYAAKPISQGQICLRARQSARSVDRPAAATRQVRAADIFAAIERVEVFARRKDGLSAGSIETSSDGQLLVVQFSSESGSINHSDGPLAVVFARLNDTLAPGQEFELEIDLANTLAFDAQGNLLRLTPRSGNLEIRHPADPYVAEAEGDKISPGQIAEIGMETFEPVGIAKAQIGITYDPAVAPGRPKIKLQNKYGRRRFSVDRTTPGLVLLTLRSPKSSWNTVPGQVVSIKLRTSSAVAPGTRSPVGLDPALTFFEAADGSLLPFELEAAQIRFESDEDEDEDDSDDD